MPGEGEVKIGDEALPFIVYASLMGLQMLYCKFLLMIFSSSSTFG